MTTKVVIRLPCNCRHAGATPEHVAACAVLKEKRAEAYRRQRAQEAEAEKKAGLSKVEKK